MIDVFVVGRPHIVRREVQKECMECDNPIDGEQWLASVGYGSGGYRAERYLCLACWQEAQPDTARINLALLRALNTNRAEGVSFDDIDDAACLMYHWMTVEKRRVWPNAALCAVFSRYGAP